MVTSPVKIPDLTPAIALDGSEEFEIVQGGVSKRATIDLMAGIPALVNAYVPVTRAINTGVGLSGGGQLTTDLNLAYDPDNQFAKDPMVVADFFCIVSTPDANQPRKVTFPNAMKAIAGLTHKDPPAAADRVMLYSVVDNAVRYSTVAEMLSTAGSLPSGGTTGQPLIKSSATDYDTEWGTLPVIGGGSGVVTLTDHGVLVGSGTDPITALAVMTNGQLLVGQTGADPSPLTITGDVTIDNLGVTAIGANKVTDAMLRQSGAVSVIGRSAATTGNVADIVAASNFQILRRSGGTLAFGSIDLSQANAVGTSILPGANGGTNNAFFAVTGPTTALKTFTFPDASATVLTTNAAVTVPQGGTGAASFTAYGVVIGGTTGTGALQSVAVGTTGQVLTSNGPGAAPSMQSASAAFGQALTRTDDTNVTLTLGGTPATALLQAVSITAGWSGLLSLARGGSNANLTASNGGIVYSTATALAILAGTATANQIPMSGATAAPSWSTATYPATALAGSIIAASASNIITSTRNPVLGVAGSVGGSLGFAGATGGTVFVLANTATGTYNFNLPIAAGSAGQPLLSGGGGATAMTFGTLGPTVGGTGITTYNQGDILYASAANVLSKLAPGSSGQYLKTLGAGANPIWDTPAGGGDVVGPASSTDNAAARFDLATGKLLQNSPLLIADTTGDLSRSGGGGIDIEGTSTNDNAPTGYIGEIIESTIALGSAVALTTNTATTVTSINLTAGDWDVFGNAIFATSGATATQFLSASNTTTNALPTALENAGALGLVSYPAASVIGNSGCGLPFGTRRYSVSGPTTIYLVVRSLFTAGTVSAYGYIGARRRR